MKSKKALFNKTVFLKTITRLWPIWVLASVIAVFSAAAYVFDWRGQMYYADYVLSLARVKNQYYDILTDFLPLALLFYSCIITAGVWSYLYSQRSVVFMHSLPISRNQLFFNTCLGGYVITIIPFLVGEIIVIVGMAATKSFLLVPVLQLLWTTLAESLLLFSIGTFCAQLVGRFVPQIVMYWLVNFVAVLTESAVRTFSTGFMYGVQSYSDSKVEFLSPVLFLADKLSYEGIMYDGHIPENWMGEWDDTILHGFEYVHIYALVGVVLILLSLVLYRQRKSEASSEVLAINVLKPILLYFLGALASLALAMLWDSLFHTNFYDVYNTGLMIFFIIIASTICYYVGRMIINRTAKVVNKKSLFGLVSFDVIMVVFTVLCSLDLGKVHEYVPSVDDIKAMNFNGGSANYILGEGEEELMKCVLDTHKAIIDEGPRKETDSSLGTVYFCFEYYLKDGSHVERYYDIPLYEEYVKENGTLENNIYTLFNLEPMREKALLLDDIGYRLYNCTIYYHSYMDDSDGEFGETKYGAIEPETVYDETVGNIPENEMPKFKEAVLKDLREGNIPETNLAGAIIGYEYTTGGYTVDIYEENEVNNDDLYSYDVLPRYSRFTTFSVNDEMVNTLKYLEDNGYTH